MVISKIKPERTGWRDQKLSQWHRQLGFNAPAVDLDFLLLEYDKGLPTAIIEYKNERAQPVSLGHPTYHALSTLAEKAEIPFFIVRYKSDLSDFHVTPVNSYAKRKLPKGERNMTEAIFVKFLYWLRGLKCPREILENLQKII